ncbi:hypothetical protein KR009_002299 [Drosophila setifemur]|nr:hypothetical protein KR009_002299 [Drosophila setifemur]
MSKGPGPLSKLYNVTINTAEKFVPNALQPLWQAPAGPRTVFFWAPLFKWSLVLAGLGDSLNRPPDVISLNQSVSMTVSALIWSRYSVVITPKNYSLLAVNLAVVLMQTYLIARHLKWRSDSASQAVYKHPNFPRNSLDDDE